MRMTASGSGSERTYRIQVCGAKMRPNGELPSDLHRQAGTVRQTGALQKSPVAVHHRSAGSGVKALRNTSVARRQAAKLGSRFGPLTPSARSANLIAGDGTKNGLSRSEQKTVSTTQNNRLTGKAPYKFESAFLTSGESCANPTFGGESDTGERYVLWQACRTGRDRLRAVRGIVPH